MCYSADPFLYGVLVMFNDIFDPEFLLTPVAVVSRQRYVGVLKLEYVLYRTLHIFGFRIARWN